MPGTDGHSRLMAADEEAALAALRHHRAAKFDPVVARHSGRVVKLMRDGALVDFASVVDAVDCALTIQPAAITGQPAMVLRIGMNLGDIILRGEDVYGDGVNIAARLKPLAAPGASACRRWCKRSSATVAGLPSPTKAGSR